MHGCIGIEFRSVQRKRTGKSKGYTTIISPKLEQSSKRFIKQHIANQHKATTTITTNRDPFPGAHKLMHRQTSSMQHLQRMGHSEKMCPFKIPTIRPRRIQVRGAYQRPARAECKTNYKCVRYEKLHGGRTRRSSRDRIN